MKALKVVDLSREWGSKTNPKWGIDGNPWGVLDKRDYTLKIEGWLYADGALVEDVTVNSHGGTHTEAPGYHMVNPPEHLKEKGIADYPPETFIGEAAVIDLTPVSKKAGIDWPEVTGNNMGYSLTAGRNSSLYRPSSKTYGATAAGRPYIYELTRDEIEQYLGRVKKGDIVLMFNKIGGVSIGTEGCRYLVKKGIKMLGFSNVGLGEGEPNGHDIMLGNDIPLIEDLYNLDKLGKERVFYIGMPWHIMGVGASPTWSIAIVEWDYTPI